MSKQPLDELIPTSFDALNEMAAEGRKAYLDSLPDDQRKFIENNDSWPVKLLKDQAEINNLDWFKMFDPFVDSLPDGMHPQFSDITKRSLDVLGSKSKQEISEILTTSILLKGHLTALAMTKRTENTSTVSQIADQKSDISLGKVFSLEKNLLWSELLAGFALIQALQAMHFWHSQHNKALSNDELGQTIMGLKLYDQSFLHFVTEGTSAITLAEELERRRKISIVAGGSRKRLSGLKEKLKNIYLERYTDFNNRQAALLLHDEMTLEEYQEFNTDNPRETIERWIAIWKKS